MPSEAVRTVAERYVLEEPIARGGMATVYKARDEVLARLVAVKVLHPELAEDPDFLQRFRTEALAAARLSHPNIVQTFDTGQDEDGRHYIVMEYCGAGTLENMLRVEGPLVADRAVAIVGHVCDALAYAHDHDVIHRDVKPGNVLVTPEGTVKVGDFGIAKAAFTSNDFTTTGKMLGTVAYVSPEQARGEEPDGRSDIYSMGVLLYELLTGRPPFKGVNQVAIAMQHLNEEPPPPRTVRGGIPRAVETAVMKALEKDPDDRFRSARELRDTLDLATGGGQRQAFASPAPRPAPVPTETEDEPGIGRVLALIVAIVVAAVVIAYVVGDGENGNGGRAGDNGGEGGASSVVRIADAYDFDPHGDGGEDPDEVPLARDGDPSTAWTTDNYHDPLEMLKPGVGLVFDLGSAQDVTEVQVTLVPAGPDIELRAASTAGIDETDFELVAQQADAPSDLRFEVEDTSARYWLLWITQLPDESGGSAGIAEVRFLR